MTRDEYPPGGFISQAMAQLPRPEPDTPGQVVTIDAGRWGRYEVAYTARKDPRWSRWLWTMAAGKRL